MQNVLWYEYLQKEHGTDKKKNTVCVMGVLFVHYLNRTLLCHLFELFWLLLLVAVFLTGGF
jgi:hypothetical protein